MTTAQNIDVVAAREPRPDHAKLVKAMRQPPRNSLIAQWENEGYVILENAVPKKKIDIINDCINDLRSRPYIGSQPFHEDRISFSHQVFEDILDAPFFPDIYAFVKFVMKEDPIVIGSISFDHGTQQAAHQDLPFFYTEPQENMVGIWLALEDIHPNSGPIFYYPGSHKFDMIRGEDIAQRDEFRDQVARFRAGELSEPEIAQLVAAMQRELPKFWNKLIETEGLQKKLLTIKRGTALIWHSKLLHGGEAIADKARTRKSIVYHMIGDQTKLYNDRQFMLYRNDEFAGLKPVPIPEQSADHLFGRFRSLGMLTFHDGEKKVTLPVNKHKVEPEQLPPVGRMAKVGQRLRGMVGLGQ